MRHRPARGCSRPAWWWDRGELSDGLAAEEVEGEGAEEGRDAVLAEQVQVDELPDGSRELRFQKLHFSTRGAGGLRGKQSKPINTAGF